MCTCAWHCPSRGLSVTSGHTCLARRATAHPQQGARGPRAVYFAVGGRVGAPLSRPCTGRCILLCIALRHPARAHPLTAHAEAARSRRPTPDALGNPQLSLTPLHPPPSRCSSKRKARRVHAHRDGEGAGFRPARRGDAHLCDRGAETAHRVCRDPGPRPRHHNCKPEGSTLASGFAAASCRGNWRPSLQLCPPFYSICAVSPCAQK